MQKRIREKSLIVVRGENSVMEIDNHFNLKEGDRILLDKSLRDDFNLTATNSISLPIFKEVH